MRLSEWPQERAHGAAPPGSCALLWVTLPMQGLGCPCSGELPSAHQQESPRGIRVWHCVHPISAVPGAPQPRGDLEGRGAEPCSPWGAGGMGQVPTRRLTVQLML